MASQVMVNRKWIEKINIVSWWQEGEVARRASCGSHQAQFRRRWRFALADNITAALRHSTHWVADCRQLHTGADRHRILSGQKSSINHIIYLFIYICLLFLNGSEAWDCNEPVDTICRWYFATECLII